MNFVTVKQLNQDIIDNIDKIPRDIDIIVRNTKKWDSGGVADSIIFK